MESISISVGFAEDTDLNGFVDSFDVTALLFDSRHPLPVTVEGEFIFRLTSSREQKSLAEWRVPPEAVAAAIRLLPPGPGYAFRLDLNKAQGDRVDRQQADLTCSFIPTGGEEVKSRGGATMRVGSVNR